MNSRFVIRLGVVIGTLVIGLSLYSLLLETDINETVALGIVFVLMLGTARYLPEYLSDRYVN